jgi:hypothetical protein
MAARLRLSFSFIASLMAVLSRGYVAMSAPGYFLEPVLALLAHLSHPFSGTVPELLGRFCEKATAPARTYQVEN